MVDEWAAAFSAVDVHAELRKVRAWCLDNPQKCKTRGGVRRFLHNWLAKEHDRGPRAGRAPQQSGGRRANW